MKSEKIFLSIIFPLTYLICIVFVMKGFTQALSIVMMLPSFSAIISILIKHKSFKELLVPFLHKISFKSFGFAVIFPLLIIFMCTFCALLTKNGVLITSWSNFLLNIVSIIIISIVFFAISLSQEYAWRGYLLPIFLKNYSIIKSNVIVGVIVLFYHLPIIFISNMSYGITRAITYTILQSLVIFFLNYSFTYIYTLSQNVVLISVMHTLWNNLNLSVLGSPYKSIPVYGNVIGKPHIINGEGLFGLFFLSIFAVYAHISFLKQSRNKK